MTSELDFSKNIDQPVRAENVLPNLESGFEIDFPEFDPDFINDTLSAKSVTIASDLDDLTPNSSLGQYLAEIQGPLLTHEQEIDLAKQIESGTLAKESLAALEAEGELIPAERQEYEKVIQAGETARTTMTESNLRLVVSVARKYAGRGLPLQDLIQEGNIGLTRGVEKYDWRKGFRFSTYAYWWIRQAVTRAVADQARTIRLPVHMIELLTKLNKTARDLHQEYGRDPTTREIADSLGLDPKKVEDTYRSARYPVSLETPVGDEDQTTLGDLIADQSTQPVAETADLKLLSEEVAEALERHLIPRETQVLKLRYGLEDGRIRTLGEVGDEIGLTRERARQIEASALRKLRVNAPFVQRFREYTHNYRPDDSEPEPISPDLVIVGPAQDLLDDISLDGFKPFETKVLETIRQLSVSGEDIYASRDEILRIALADKIAENPSYNYDGMKTGFYKVVAQVIRSKLPFTISKKPISFERASNPRLGYRMIRRTD